MKKWLILLIVIAVVGGVVLFLIGGKAGGNIPVVKCKVTKGELNFKISARGKIEAKDRFELRAKIPGVVMFILEEGTAVKKGELIVSIDDKELLAKKYQQEANLVNYKNTLAKLKRGFDIKELENKAKEAEVLFKEAERLFEINKRLFESKVICLDELERIKTNYDKAKLQLEIVRIQLKERIKTRQEEIKSILATIKAIEKDLVAIEQRIRFSKIISPICGIVAQKETEEGSWVNQGQLLAVVVSDKEFIAKANLDEVDISKISLNMPAFVIPDAFLGKKVLGKIKKIAPSPRLTEKINTFEVTIQLEPTDIDLKSEMLCDVIIISKLKKDVLKIPQETIVNIGGKEYVFVINKDNTVSKREIKSGLSDEDEIEVLWGLKEGEEVVLNPPLELKDKAKVVIKEE